MLKRDFHILLLFGFLLSFSSCSLFGNEDGSIKLADPYDRPLRIDEEPTWSPDGKWIAFTHNQMNFSDPDTSGIYLIKPDGTGKQLWLPGRGPRTPDWSPDGEWILFVNGGKLFKRTVRGDSLVQLTSKGASFFPSWSPNGEWIVFDSNRREGSTHYYIWKMDKNGENISLIAYEPNQGDTRSPSWDTDNQIFHVRYLIDSVGEEIFIMDSIGGSEKRLTFNKDLDRYPHYSAVQDKIIFTSQRNNSISDIWIMNSDGSNPQNLTPEKEIDGLYGRWSPDGKYIVFTNFTSDNGRLWIMNKDGSDKRQLTH